MNIRKFYSEQDAAGVPRDCQHMGFSATEMGRLASEGAYQLANRRLRIMDMMMKVLMGGWLPQGQRSQWMAFSVALGAIVTAFVQWGAGEMNMTQLMQLLTDKWPVLMAAYGMYFV